jgi:hypothetical protein
MTPEAGLSANAIVLRVIFLFTVALLAACDRVKEPASQDLQAETGVVPLPVREWHPTPKHMSTPQGNFPLSATPSSPVMSPQLSGQGHTPQQPWAVAAQRPVYMQPSPVIVFQGQQYVPAQQQQGWTYQQPVTQPAQPSYQPQQPYAVSGPRYAQRPWGNTAATSEDNSRSNASLESWPPNTHYSPAGIPASGGYPGWNTGSYGVVPPANYYGNVWQYP